MSTNFGVFKIEGRPPISETYARVEDFRKRVQDNNDGDIEYATWNGVPLRQGRQRFIVTCQPEGTDTEPALAVITIDPQDIYQGGIDADLRALAWKSLGEDPEDRLK